MTPTTLPTWLHTPLEEKRENKEEKRKGKKGEKENEEKEERKEYCHTKRGLLSTFSLFFK